MYSVCGKLIDDETRCEHWHSPIDIIALKFKCCPNKYYPCFSCHVETNEPDHKLIKYDLIKDKNEKVVLCGKCKTELTFDQYQSKLTEDSLKCPSCLSDFNPGCKLHYCHYFDSTDDYKEQCKLMPKTE
ncbi:hypothetical protein HANVADRAFT_1265 [Hanseniaspora valbyensis NRRL Y-1626]|uniref:CHY-type domain-containing protein n=1 Tax=Hanseniaspora valbyensis NRRL Y-1626 TaxID=766949 RepID=A0A1B7TG98_9ASCO|nr:hypothetical protein HANVADRAFT_1265 [Hanseniaspora valbyensis NRRL Y-1626]